MNPLVAGRLCIMMFLQFFLWGSWYVTAYLFLGKIGFDGPEIGWTYTVGPLAGMISPFFVGMIADRFFAPKWVLATMHLLGAAAMFAAVQMMAPGVDTTGDVTTFLPENVSPLVINLLFFGHMLCYYPTLALTNTIALQTMTNPEKEFPLIRVFGTIGWIVAGMFISAQRWDAALQMFEVAAATAAVLGIYALTLPHTVPPSKGKRVTINEVFGLDALVLLKRPSFAIFMFSSFLICIPLAFYYQLAGKFVDAAGLANPAFKMTFGQMSEVVFMLVMPLFFARLGVKWMLFVGMFAWVVRYGLFAAAADDGIAWMVLSGILLHGICYDFFFVTGQIYTDKSAPREIRGQAQGMLVLFTLGLGMAIGAQCAGYIEPLFTVQGEEKTALDEQANAIGGRMQTLQDELDRLEGRKLVINDQGNPVLDDEGNPQEVNYLVSQWRLMFPAPATEANAQQASQVGAELATLREQRSEVLLQVVDWKTLWAIPAGFAFVVMIGFAIFFRTDVPEGEVSEGEVADADARESMGGP